MVRIWCILIGYVFGLFQTGYLYGKMNGVDIRQKGSGNSGTTNALRVMGKKAGAIVFLGDLLKLWLAMALLLRKYQIRSSGAAAASAYVLCQFCVFMALALLLTLGKSSELGILILGVLLFIDYRQWLQIGNRKALWLTIKTGLVYFAAIGLFYTLLGTFLILLTFYGA